MFKNPIVIILLLFIIGSGAYTAITDGFVQMLKLFFYFFIGGLVVLLIEFVKRQLTNKKRNK
ncbi:hypothetical protein [Kurthia sibirica]|uniref:Uncharacterized protein n=1 Tax=Kurthia sibirica TaxID=202750 RepID=A0A2U3APZ4_9BACL|nr:hypothetical protein [Kurthia sibirica]PWI26594.1 hypothetical protein DEX24_02190 [Kurthia sibirica]GEK32851.1 hypothetical protein KSI01_03840 [Kurthia sibirica]